ncbi:MAG: NINE protein [Pseudomonadota bacterium]
MDAHPYQAPQADLTLASVFCRQCGSKIAASATQCPDCQASQNLNPKSKITAGVLALLLGGLGIHRLYLGQWWGLIYLVLFWTWIPAIIALVEGIVFLCTDNTRWQQKYGNVRGSSGLVLGVVGVVIIVPMIGILASVAIPQYQKYVERSKQAQLQQQR